MTLLAALDVGTTRVKGGLFRWRHGTAAELVESADARLPPVRFAGLAAEQEPADLLAGAVAVLATLSRRAPPADWAALALTTQRGSLLPLGKDGAPTHPLVNWLDRRGAGRSGGTWGWFAQHAPDVLARTARVGTLAEWLGPAVLAHLRPAGPRLVGSDASAAPARSGVPRLVDAGGDKNSELIGAGGLMPGRGVVSFGTAVSLGCLLPTTSILPSTDGLFVTPAPVPGMQQVEVGLPFGGGVWAWVARLFPAAARALCNADLTPNAPLFVPYLAGSLGNARATGAWHELTAVTMPAQLVASALEGILFDLKRGVACLPVPPTQLALTGGGLANPVLAQWLADVLGVPVSPLTDDGAGPAGAAAAAAVALGLGDWPIAAAALARPLRPMIAPRPEAATQVAQRYPNWLKFI